MVRHPERFRAREFGEFSQLQDVVAGGQPSVNTDIYTNRERVGRMGYTLSMSGNRRALGEKICCVSTPEPITSQAKFWLWR